jgi:hypothetical protein
MDDIDLQLKFSDPAASAAFSADLDAAEFPDFRAATFEAKQNFDAATLIVVLKVLAAGFSALLAFLKFVREFLKKSGKPPMTLTYRGRTVEVSGDASDEELKRICDELTGTK